MPTIDPRVLALAFVLGCLLLWAARTHARTLTLILAAAAVLLGATVGEILLDRLGVPSGSAEDGVLFWPSHPD